MEYSMKNIEELNKSRLPIVKVNKNLNQYDTLPLFQDKVDKANETLKRVGLPKLQDYQEDETLLDTQDVLLFRINHTIELIKKYDSNVKQAIALNAPTHLIEAKQKMKAQLVNELIALMAEMDVQFELKQAAFRLSDWNSPQLAGQNGTKVNSLNS